MNDLVLMKDLNALATTDAAWACFPLGHTEYQIRNFILNRRDFPTEASRYRQGIRELWARWEAYWQNKDRLDQIVIDRMIHEAKLDFSRLRLARGIVRMYRASRLSSLLKLAQLQRQETALLHDLERRVIREAMVFIDEVKTLQPEDPGQAFSKESEDQFWRLLAKDRKELAEIVPRNGGK